MQTWREPASLRSHSLPQGLIENPERLTRNTRPTPGKIFNTVAETVMRTVPVKPVILIQPVIERLYLDAHLAGGPVKLEKTAVRTAVAVG